jgi:hypothetical protein
MLTTAGVVSPFRMKKTSQVTDLTMPMYSDSAEQRALVPRMRTADKSVMQAIFMQFSLSG